MLVGFGCLIHPFHHKMMEWVTWLAYTGQLKQNIFSGQLFEQLFSTINNLTAFHIKKLVTSSWLPDENLASMGKTYLSRRVPESGCDCRKGSVPGPAKHINNNIGGNTQKAFPVACGPIHISSYSGLILILLGDLPA